MLQLDFAIIYSWYLDKERLEMKSLNVLKYNQKLMAAIGIYSHNLTGPGNEFFKSMVTYYYLFVVLGLFILSSGSFAFKNMDKFLDALEAMSMVIVGIQCGGMHLSIGLNMKAVKALHLKLQGIVDEIISSMNRFSHFIRKNYFCKQKLFFLCAEDDDELFDIYRETEQKCRKLTKTLIYYLCSQEFVFVFPILFSTYCVCVGNYDTSSWISLFGLDLPFKQTVWGWYLTWFCQINMSIVFALICFPITSYFICCCFYIDAMCSHFEILINSIDRRIDRMLRQKNQQNYQNLMRKVNDTFYQAIDVHAKIFEWVFFAWIDSILNTLTISFISKGFAIW